MLKIIITLFVLVDSIPTDVSNVEKDQKNTEDQDDYIKLHMFDHINFYNADTQKCQLSFKTVDAPKIIASAIRPHYPFRYQSLSEIQQRVPNVMEEIQQQSQIPVQEKVQECLSNITMSIELDQKTCLLHGSITSLDDPTESSPYPCLDTDGDPYIAQLASCEISQFLINFTNVELLSKKIFERIMEVYRSTPIQSERDFLIGSTEYQEAIMDFYNSISSPTDFRKFYRSVYTSSDGSIIKDHQLCVKEMIERDAKEKESYIWVDGKKIQVNPKKTACICL